MALQVACKCWSSINNGAWLRRFDGVTKVEKSCVAKGINRKKQRQNILLLQINMRFPQTSNTLMFAMFKNFMHSQLLKPIFLLSPNRCETHKEKLSNFRLDFYRSVMSPFAIKLFLLPFSSHCSTHNIGFSDSGYVIKPLQPNSAVHGAPPFAGYRHHKSLRHRSEK